MIYAAWSVALFFAFLAAFFFAQLGRRYEQLEEERLCHAAARWLAGANFVALAALETRVGRAALVEAQGEARPLLGLGQGFPLDRCPPELREAGTVYNARHRAGPLLATVAPGWEESRLRAQERTLAAALTNFAVRHAARASEEAAIGYNEAWICMIIAEEQLRLSLGRQADPETVLPRNY